jgi:NADH dehydrogenase
VKKTREQSRVVIVGAGFGGLAAARGLSSSGLDVLVIDRNNYHTFNALLYQVAAAELEPEDISYPVRTILRTIPNARFLMDDVEGVDLPSKVIRAGNREISYDFLVLATGSTTRFYNTPGAPEHAFELKTLDHAISLRNHMLCCLESAANESNPDMRRSLLTFVIVGGGPTGVEFAGALAELIRGPIAKDYPVLHKGDLRVALLQAADSLLPEMPEPLREYGLARLSRIGVEVQLQMTVTKVTEEAVYLEDGSVLPAATVVWTAGVQGGPLAQSLHVPTARDGRVLVGPALQLTDHPEVYVIGDLAYWEHEGRPLPFVAPVAVQQGAAVAANIRRQVSGQPALPFAYRDKGSLATIGRMTAVARIGGRRFTGLSAWILWLAVHIFNLIGFRNRVLVMVNWAWDFLLYERGVRLILPSESCATLKERKMRVKF